APERPAAPERPTAPERPAAAPRPQAAPPNAPVRPPPRTRTEPLDDPYAEADLPILGQARPSLPTRGKSAAPRTQDLDLELDSHADVLDDLPALPAHLGTASKIPADAGLPALRRSAPAAGAPSFEFDMDLPAVPRPRRSSPAPVDDLPAVPNQRKGAPLAPDFDLPVLASDVGGLPSVQTRGVDLPSPVRASGSPRASDDLFEFDLPTPSADDTAGFDDDMPELALDAVLPSPAVGLPSPATGSNLPSVLDALPLVADPFPMTLDSLPRVADSLPTAVDAYPRVADAAPERSAPRGSFGDADAFSLDSVPPLSEGAGFGELELPLGSDPFAGPASTGDLRKAEGDGFREIPGPDFADVRPDDRGGAADEEFDPFAMESVAPKRPAPRAAAVERQAGGGVAFGEVNLGGDDAPAADVALDEVRPRQLSQTDEDMEFGAIPQEEPAVPQNAAPPAGSQVRMNVGVLPPEQRKKSKNAARIGLGLLVVMSVGGGALALVPDVGPFGYHFAVDTLKSGEYRAATERAVRESRKLLAQDTFAAATRGVESVEAARKQLPRVRPLAAYAAFTGFLSEMRFGSDSKTHARATVSLEGLSEAGEVEHLALAKAAREAVDGKPPMARRMLKTLVSKSRSNVDAWVTLAELELREGDAKAARAAWESAKKIEDSPRTSFGLARALLLAEDVDGAESLARAALAKAPDHTGAKLLLARVTWKRDASDETVKLVSGVVDAKPQMLSPQELVLAHTLLGNIYLARGRVGLAEAAFTAALKADPKAASALTGLGTTLYQSARYSEALARFEAAAQADPADLMAKIGIVKCRLVLERVKEGSELARTLRETHPKSADAALWHGRALEALGQREEAETAYRRAVELSPKDASRVEPYVALSMLLNQLGRLTEAQALLDQARKELPDSPAIHRAMGDVALAQGRYDDALTEYNLALKLDAT
ncbi:MAG TPA: tetratricopeptide repeat protein, partial [Polyangiaceae bacterium]|nr:tetratricopeptide repeat protein [Polyangiaceae bacterium]